MEHPFSIVLPSPSSQWLKDGGEVGLPEEFLAAALVANNGRKSFSLAEALDLEALRSRFLSHPDVRVLSHWMSSKDGDFAYELGVMFWLSAMAFSEWMCLPRVPRAEHTKLYKKISDSCDQLCSLLLQTGDQYKRGGGWGMSSPRVTDLLTDTEMKVVLQCVQQSEEHAGALDHGLPTVDMLLERLGKAAQRLEKEGPIHSQPGKRGAARGYFVRRMSELLMQRYKDCPDDVLAVLTTLTLDDTTEQSLANKLRKKRNVVGKQ